MIYPSIVLKKGKERPVLSFHPWIFSGAIDLIDDEIKPGELVSVLSADKKFLGTGYFNPKSQISVRMLSFQEEVIDGSFFERKLRNAQAMRKQFLPSKTNSYRLIHSEGDGLPGLIADVYGDHLVIQFQTLGMEKLKPLILEAFSKHVFKNIFERSDSKMDEKEGKSGKSQILSGSEPPAQIEIEENGHKFLVDVRKGQKSGFFLDQRENRKLVGEHSKGKRVLNCFSYTGGFSVYAAKNGAKSVTSVEISEPASALAKKNFELNGLNTSNFDFISKDVFDYLRENDSEYDLVILDPPAFSKSKNDIDKASRGYKDINLQAMRRVSAGGLLFTFSCSSYIDQSLFQKIIFGAAKDAKKELKIVAKTSHPFDHPINIYHPEGEYSKGLVCVVN